jgi:hypothetical protein
MSSPLASPAHAVRPRRYTEGEPAPGRPPLDRSTVQDAES